MKQDYTWRSVILRTVLVFKKVIKRRNKGQVEVEKVLEKHETKLFW